MRPYFEEDGIQVFHADCREIMPQLSSESVDVIWTDPPYGHGNHVDDLNARLNDHRGLEQQPIENDSGDLMREVVDAAMLQAARILKRDCCCCCCCCGGGGPRPTFAWVADRLDRDGLQFFHAVIWDKVNPGLGWRYRRQYEMVMVAHRKGGTLAWADPERAVPNIYSQFPERDRLHPNEKPQSMVAWFLGLHSTIDSLILDPFCGSGTTLRAAKDLGRRAIGIEIDERYAEISAKRLSQKVFNF